LILIAAIVLSTIPEVYRRLVIWLSPRLAGRGKNTIHAASFAIMVPLALGIAIIPMTLAILVLPKAEKWHWVVASLSFGLILFWAIPRACRLLAYWFGQKTPSQSILAIHAMTTAVMIPVACAIAMLAITFLGTVAFGIASLTTLLTEAHGNRPPLLPIDEDASSRAASEPIGNLTSDNLTQLKKNRRAPEQDIQVDAPALPILNSEEGSSLQVDYEAAQAKGLEKGFRIASEQIRPQLPIKVSSDTTLISVVSVGTEMIYMNELNFAFPQDNIDLAKILLQEKNQKNVCSDESMKMAISSGARYTYVYSDVNGDIVRITISIC
jgi:hypothetical protein